MTAVAPQQQREPGAFKAAVLVNFSASLVTIAAGVLTSAILARGLGPDGRGEYAAILIWPNQLVGLGQLGMPAATVFFVSRNPGLARRVQANALLIAGGGVALVTVASWLAMPLLLPAQSADTIHAARVYCVLFGAANTLWGIGASRLQGERRFRVFSALRIGQVLLWLVVLTAYWLLGWSDPGVLAWLFAGTFLAVVPLSLLIGGKAEESPPGEVGARQLLSYGVQAMLASLPQQYSRRLDQLTLASLAAPAVMGQYAVAATLAVPVGIATAPIANTIIPFLSEAYARADRAALVAKAMRTAVAGFTSLAAIMALTVGPTIWFLFGDRYLAAIAPAIVLAPAAAMSGLATILEDALLGLGKPEAVLRVELVGLVVGAAGLFLALSYWPLVGAAVAALVSYSVSFWLAGRAVGRQLSLGPAEMLVPRREDWRYLLGVGREILRRITGR